MPFGDRETDAAWLAALILGEGTIQLTHRFVSITISNSDVAIVEEAKRIIGHENCALKIYADKRSKLWRPCYTLHVWGGYEIKIALLSWLFPYLVGRKRELAGFAIQLMESRLAKKARRGGRTPNGVRYDLFEQMLIESVNALNRKGG